MSRALLRDHIEADLARVETLIRETPTTSALSRASLEARAGELREQLATLAQREGTNAEVAISFEGGPVIGSASIDARFATDALHAYQWLVTAVAAKRLHGEKLHGTGPLPDADLARLHISNAIHGSFGFELREPDNVLFGPSHLADAVDRSLALLASAMEGDEAFADSIDEDGQRVRDATLGFLRILRKNHAAVRLRSDTRDVQITVADASTAAHTVEAVEVGEEEQEIPGTFGGVLLHREFFEHTPVGTDKPIYGKLDPGLEPREAEKWFGQRCTAHVRVVRRSIAGKEPRISYVLLRLQA